MHRTGHTSCWWENCDDLPRCLYDSFWLDLFTRPETVESLFRPVGYCRLSWWTWKENTLSPNESWLVLSWTSWHKSIFSENVPNTANLNNSNYEYDCLYTGLRLLKLYATPQSSSPSSDCQWLRRRWCFRDYLASGIIMHTTFVCPYIKYYKGFWIVEMEQNKIQKNVYYYPFNWGVNQSKKSRTDYLKKSKEIMKITYGLFYPSSSIIMLLMLM